MVIPCYRVKNHIVPVLAAIGPEVDTIYVVDDCCPEQTGAHVRKECTDPRIRVLFHDANQGVGGATMTGYRQALADDAGIIVKLDGDGQMDPALIPRFIRPLLDNSADYTKGNRFYSLENLADMPRLRLVGNSILSFMTKLSSGYWNVFDPTNGYTAIHASVAALLPFDKINHRYFFESDILFRLNTLRAVVLDIPMSSRYAGEQSSLNPLTVIPQFLVSHTVNFCKRLLYNYYLRDFNIASLHLVFGIVLLTFGMYYGGRMWLASIATGITASSGTVMLAGLPTLSGIQLLLAFFSFDCGNVPKVPVSPRL